MPSDVSDRGLVSWSAVTAFAVAATIAFTAMSAVKDGAVTAEAELMQRQK